MNSIPSQLLKTEPRTWETLCSGGHIRHEVNGKSAHHCLCPSTHMGPVHGDGGRGEAEVVFALGLGIEQGNCLGEKKMFCNLNRVVVLEFIVGLYA